MVGQIFFHYQFFRFFNWEFIFRMSTSANEEEKVETMKKNFQTKVHDELLKQESIPDVAKFEPLYEKNQEVFMSALQSLASKCLIFYILFRLILIFFLIYFVISFISY